MRQLAQDSPTISVRRVVQSCFSKVSRLLSRYTCMSGNPVRWEYPLFDHGISAGVISGQVVSSDALQPKLSVLNAPLVEIGQPRLPTTLVWCRRWSRRGLVRTGTTASSQIRHTSFGLSGFVLRAGELVPTQYHYDEASSQACQRAPECSSWVRTHLGFTFQTGSLCWQPWHEPAGS